MPARMSQVIANNRFFNSPFLLLLAVYLAFFTTPANSQTPLSKQPVVQSHNVFPECENRLSDQLDVSENLCLRLIYQGDPLIKPRQIIQWTDRYFLIADMGGWVSGKGIIWLFDRVELEFKPVLTGLKVPHGLVRFGSDQIIIGERHQISRIRLNSSFDVIETEVLLSRNDFGSHKHPLSALILDADKNLILNFGAPSDQCDHSLIEGECFERKEFAQVRRYLYDPVLDRWTDEYQVLGFGLRNSMALAVHQSGTVLQAENGMDFDRVHSPFETLNELDVDKDFGWPYCHSQLQTNALWKHNKVCSGYDAPVALLPPHGAPLSMIYYQSEKISLLTGRLIIPLHSYQKPGHRVLALTVNERGLPIINPEQKYQYSSPEGDQLYRSFPVARGADFDYLISDLRMKNALSVSGIIEATDGSIYMLDDINKSIFQLDLP